MRLLYFLLLTSSLAFAQSRDSSLLQFGIRGGVGFQEVRFTPEATTVNTVQGNEYGLAVRYFDNPLVGFQGELNYLAAGWQEVFPGFDERYERMTDYLEVQLLTQLSPGRGVFQPMLQAGPYLSAPVADSETLPAGFTADPETTYYGRDLDFRLNYGMRVGLGFNLTIGRITGQVSGRYTIGFSDIIRSGSSQAAISQRQAYGGFVGIFFQP